MARTGALLLLLAAAGCSGQADDRVFGVGDCFSVYLKYRAQGEERSNDRLCTILKKGEAEIYMHPLDEVHLGGLSAAGIRKAIREKATVKGVDVLDVRVEFHGRIELPDDPRGLLNVMVLSDRPAGPDPVYTYPPMIIPGEPPRTLQAPHQNPVYRAQLAVSRMFDLGVAAFPVLIDHLKDKRQSVPVSSVVPCSLGAACYGILDSQVHVRLSKSASPDFDFLASADILTWWKERRGRSLQELQGEAAVYTLVVAEAEKDNVVLDAVRQRLENLGWAEWKPVQAAFDGFRTRYAFPAEKPSIQRLIEFLAPSGDTYAERRFSSLRAGQARRALVDEERAALTLLVAHADHAKVGDACLDLIRWIVEGDLRRIPDDDVPDLSALGRETVRAWWEKRSTMSLRELRLEAARHWLDKAELAPFADEESRRTTRGHVRKVIQTLESDK